jgi:hypothetical protein
MLRSLADARLALAATQKHAVNGCDSYECHAIEEGKSRASVPPEWREPERDRILRP